MATIRRLQKLLFSYSGRIGRKQFWLGVVCVLLATIALSAVAIAMGFSQTISQQGYQVVNGERTEISGFSVSTTPAASLVIAILMTAPWLAIATKRRRDRGSGGYDVVAFTVLNLLMQTLGVLGLRGDLVLALGVVLSVWGIVLLILLGFLKGDEGTNSYGGNPLKAETS